MEEPYYNTYPTSKLELNEHQYEIWGFHDGNDLKSGLLGYGIISLISG